MREINYFGISKDCNLCNRYDILSILMEFKARQFLLKIDKLTLICIDRCDQDINEINLQGKVTSLDLAPGLHFSL